MEQSQYTELSNRTISECVSNSEAALVYTEFHYSIAAMF